MFKRRSKPHPQPVETTIEVGGRAIPLVIRVNRLARQLILRVDAKRDAAVLTLPRGVSRSEGLVMVRERADWLVEQLDCQPTRVPFVDGAEVPLEGARVRIRHRPEGRGTAWLEDGMLCVSGRAEHLTRRITDWYKAQARRKIAARAHAHTEALGLKHGRIFVRDTRSRWGSCAANRDLSFCWRLIMAPPHVLDYVVAHEVAHLAAMNHGERFWSLVAELVPGYAEAKIWLRRHGEELHRYG